MTTPGDGFVPWRRGQPLRQAAVGSRVHFHRRGKYVEGIIEMINVETGFVRVRVGKRTYQFHRFYRDGEDVWLTGQKGYSRTRLYPGTHEEWRQEYERVTGRRYPT